MSPAMASGFESRGRPDEALEMLGRLLRSLREAIGMSPSAAGKQIGGSESKISRIERGRIRIKAIDLHKLLTLYGVTDHEERRALLQFARRLNDRQWWDDYGDVLDGWFRSYLVLESVARHIRTYEVRFIPGLLQTPAYANAVVRLQHSNEDEIRRRVDVRLKRQRAVLDIGAPHLWAVVDNSALDEAALPEGIAGPDVMREQIEFLMDAAQRPNVVIQILPPGAGGRAGIGNSFSLLRLRLKGLSDVAYLEHIDDALFLDDPGKADRYGIAMSRLTIAASEPEDTMTILRQALDRISAT